MARRSPAEILTKYQLKKLADNGWNIVADPAWAGKAPSLPAELPVPPLELPVSTYPAIWVTIPAWGDHYVDYATRYVIPSVRAAMAGAACPRRMYVKFIVTTDQPHKLAQALAGCDCEFRRPDGPGHAGLTTAHRDALARAPDGALVFLLNADIVVSREIFDFAHRAFVGEKRVVASVGTRTLIRGEPPPIGATSRELLAWAWRNRHPITEDLVWGRGKSTITTMLFFENAAGVTLRCFHVHPFMLVKDRDLTFKGTVDDDLLARYEEREIYYVENAEVGFAEMSLASVQAQRFKSGSPITVDSVASRGRRFMAAHMRNFKHPLRIIGSGNQGDGPVADAILYRLAHPLPVVQPRPPRISVAEQRRIARRAAREAAAS